MLQQKCHAFHLFEWQTFLIWVENIELWKDYGKAKILGYQWANIDRLADIDWLDDLTC